MEVAARLGGGHDAELVGAVTGVDLNAAVVAFSLGEPPAMPEVVSASGGGAIVFFVPPPGELVRVDGVDAAAAGEGVQWVRVYRGPGHVFGELRRGADRAGAVLAVGRDRAEALAPRDACRPHRHVRHRIAATRAAPADRRATTFSDDAPPPARSCALPPSGALLCHRRSCALSPQELRSARVPALSARDISVLGPPASSPAFNANGEIWPPQDVLCVNFVSIAPQPVSGRGWRRRDLRHTAAAVPSAGSAYPSLMRAPRTTRLGFQPPAIGEEEIDAVAETMRSGWLTTGPRAAELERRMAEYLEAEHVLAVSSGTAAMHLALLALDVGPGDEVITSPITWPATANVIEHCGATPIFVDVRESDLNLDPDARPGGDHRADAGDPARSPCGTAVRSRAAARARPSCRRGCCARDREHAIGAASSALCRMRRASPCTRRRTSPRAKAGSSRPIATTLRNGSARCA